MPLMDAQPLISSITPSHMEVRNCILYSAATIHKPESISAYALRKLQQEKPSAAAALSLEAYLYSLKRV